MTVGEFISKLAVKYKGYINFSDRLDDEIETLKYDVSYDIFQNTYIVSIELELGPDKETAYITCNVSNWGEKMTLLAKLDTLMTIITNNRKIIESLFNEIENRFNEEDDD